MEVKAERRRIDGFELWCWRRLFESSLDCKEIKPVNPKEINPEYSLEKLMLKLKLQYFSHLMQRANSGKDPSAGKHRRQKEKGVAENETVGWHHQLNGHEFEQTLGNCEGWESLECCNPWGCKELDRTLRLEQQQQPTIIA